MEEQLQTAETVQPEPEVIEEHVEPVADDQPVVESETKAETEKPAITSLSEGMLFDLGEGEPIPAEEMKKRLMLHSDYTRKTQEVAEQRKAIEVEQQELEPYRNHKRFIEENPYLTQVFNQVVETWRNQGEIMPLDEVLNTEAGPYLNHLMVENSKLQSEVDRLSGEVQETKFGTEMSTVLSDLKAEFKDLVTPDYEQSLKQQAKERGWSADDVKRIAKGDLAEMKLKQLDTKKIEAETIKKIQQNAATSTGSLAQEGADHKVGYTQMSEAQKKALRERVLRGENVQL